MTERRNKVDAVAERQQTQRKRQAWESTPE